MKSALKFDAPVASAEHLALRRSVAEAGLNDDNLRDLLWLTNCHPRLIGHAQVFGNLSRLFSSQMFSDINLEWAGDWKRQVKAWAQLTGWIWEQTSSLSRINELSGDYHIHPAQGDANAVLYEHPILRRGLVRHSIVSAIWVFHHSAVGGPDMLSHAGQRYMALQGHVLAVCLECRYRLSTREFYESYSGQIERPTAPMPGFVISPGLRALSQPAYDVLLEQLPSSRSTLEYAEQFRSMTFLTSSISDVQDAARARRDIECLKRFFGRFMKVLDGWKPPQTTRRGWGGGGSKTRRPGFIQLTIAPTVYVESIKPAPDDPDFAAGYGQRVFIDRDPQNDPNALEASGASPNETLEPCFNLIAPEDYGGRYVQIQHQRRALEMRAQQLTFANEILTPLEIDFAWKVAERLQQRIEKVSPLAEEIISRALTGLLAKLCTAFGQSLESVLNSSLIWITPDATAWELSNDDPEPALLIRSTVPGQWEGAEFVGLRLHGIMPSYRTVLPEQLEEIDGAWTDSFVLPDLVGIGPDLIASLQKTRPVGKAFSIRKETVRRTFREALGTLHGKRITFDKLSIYLPRKVTGSSGDQSLAWMVFADDSHKDEPRMHYTRHKVTKIHTTFRRVSQHLARILGCRVPDNDPVEIAPESPDDAVGARFVLPLTQVREIVAVLVEFLVNPRIDRDDPAHITAYHNHYLFYLMLCKVMETATRSPADPSDLYRRWQSQQDLSDAIASLSDKTSIYFDKSRLVRISNDLGLQFSHYQDHLNHLADMPILSLAWATGGRQLGPFITLELQGSRLVMQAATEAWFAEMLQSVSSYSIPTNFARATLRTELLDRDCPAQVVDALLGHASQGESPFGLFSSFDYEQYRKELSSFLDNFRKELGFRQIASRLIPFDSRRRDTP